MAKYPHIEPVRLPVMYQRWGQISFIHWRYPADVLALHVPNSLTVETFEGSAWLGLTPFIVSGLRAPFVPPLPWISKFPETNLRTYVAGPDGRRGIWFFSLDAARALAVAGARAAYGLPYAWSKMRVGVGTARVEYRSRRCWPGNRAHSFIAVEHGGSAEGNGLEIFLTARFRLYSKVLGRLVAAQVEHPPWPLERARAVALEQTITEAAGLPRPDGPPLVHFSKGVETRIGAPVLVRC